MLIAAKSLQSCLTLCDPIDGSPPGSPIPGILQAITEIKSTLEGTNSRITEAEDRKSKVEDRMVEINETEREKKNE